MLKNVNETHIGLRKVTELSGIEQKFYRLNQTIITENTKKLRICYVPITRLANKVLTFLLFSSQ